MDCPEFRYLFSDFVDGALDAADAARCRGHLAACEACRRLEAAYRTGVRTLRDLAPPSPARDLSVRILHRARREPRLAILVGGYGLAGAMLLATLLAVVAVDLRGHSEAVPPVAWLADGGTGPSVGPDLVTLQVHDAPAYGTPATPYVVLPAVGPEFVTRPQFEVPAVWSGR